MFYVAFKTYKQCPDSMIAPLVGLSYVAFSSAISNETHGLLDFFFYFGAATIFGYMTIALVIYAIGPPLGAICGYYLFNFLFTSPKGGSGSGSEPRSGSNPQRSNSDIKQRDDERDQRDDERDQRQQQQRQ